MTKLLIVSSNIHKKLAAIQLENCLKLVEKSNHTFQVEMANAGTYEIPFIINSYHQTNPFDAYIGLGLVLKANLDHYDYIMSHIKYCFTHFSLNGIAVGNGIVSGETWEELSLKINSSDPCVSSYESAFNAVDYLIRLKKNLATHSDTSETPSQIG